MKTNSLVNVNYEYIEKVVKINSESPKELDSNKDENSNSKN